MAIKPTLDVMNPPMTYESALVEANRCLLCEDPPCVKGCPASVPVRDFIRKFRFGDLEGSAAAIQRANVLGGVCGVVCETSMQCQKECTAAKLGKPIDIGGLQRFIIESVAGQGLSLPFGPGEATGKRVAVVGGGPAGLATAAELRRLGHAVTLFDRHSRLGGTARYGIPPFRLHRSLLDAETEAVTALGVDVHLGQDADAEQLQSDFDAVVLATGQVQGRKLGIEGEDLPQVLDGLAVLSWLRESPGSHPLHGKVLVVGGGNTSMDVAAAALDLGAQEVTVLYRRSQAEMPAWPSEREKALSLGISLRTLTVPVEVLGEQKVEGVRCRAMILGEADSYGRRRPVPAEGESFVIPADFLLVAVGQGAEEPLPEALGLTLTNRGEVEVSQLGRTSNPRVFAAGDLAGGPKTVVASVAQGKKVAQVVHQTLTESVAPEPSWREALPPEVSLEVDFCGVHFLNPFILAAAPPSDDYEMVRRAFQAGWAGAVLKTTSVEGTPVPLKYPMMAAMDLGGGKVTGLGNIDLISEHHIDVIEERIGRLKEEFPDRIVVGSMMGATKEDWQQLAQRLSAAGADLIECSFSCPQGSLGSRPGAMLGQDVALSRTVAGWVKEAAGDTPVVIKLTPQVADIAEVAQAVKDAGADAVCASNTIPSLMGLDPETLRPRPTVGTKSSYSGLSGPAILPITLRNIAEIAKTVGIPITGTGGPVTAYDAVQIMAVGATTVQFCTAVMTYGYRIIEDLLEGLAWELSRRHLTHPSQLVGKALDAVATHDALVQAGDVVCHIDTERCIGCGRCFLACRDGGHQAISFDLESRQPTVDPERCVGCAFCTQVCPVSGCMWMETRD